MAENLSKPILGGFLNGLPGLFGGLAGNLINSNIASQNMAFQREMNEQNIAFQREINDTNYYRQLAENNLTREREDNAVQRAMADVTKAGLSKTLATGMSANSASMNIAKSDAPNVQSLKNEFRYRSALEGLDILDHATQIYKTLTEGKVAEAQANNLASSSAFYDVQAENYGKKVASDILRDSYLNRLSLSQIRKLQQDMKIQGLDFGQLFNYGLTSTGKSPETISETNNLEIAKLQSQINLLEEQARESRMSRLIVQPLSTALRTIFALRFFK